VRIGQDRQGAAFAGQQQGAGLAGIVHQRHGFVARHGRGRQQRGDGQNPGLAQE
jgi:hypothetical protein